VSHPNNDQTTDTGDATSAFCADLLGDFDTSTDAAQAGVGQGGLPSGSLLLVVKRGPNAGSRFRLDQPVTSAGRHPDSGVFLDDVSVSRRHAEFRREHGECVLVDTGSLNGTYVNRKPVESVALTNGDEIQMGKFRLVFLNRPHDTLTPTASHPSAKTLVGAKPDIVGSRHHHVDHWILRLTADDRRRHSTLSVGWTQCTHPGSGIGFERRKYRSSTVASVSLPTPVGVSVRSPHRVRPAAASGVKSRRSPSGALRADLSGVAVPRRRRFRRATTPASAINVATVLFDTRQFIAYRSAATRTSRYGWRTGRRSSPLMPPAVSDAVTDLWCAT
jgi:pSer/pThr/pTyr-binding forkhead associated (FHA) protein